MEESKRLKKLPPYLFDEILKKKKELIEKGVDVIDFGVGDPDLPTPAHIVEAMKKAVENPSYHHYPLRKGLKEFRKAISDYYRKNHGVDIDPEREICVLIGAKEGIAHFPFAYVNEGDIVLVPEPAYPVYHRSTILAGGEPYFLPLLEENDFLPQFEKIPSEILSKAKILYLNYPNNPTTAFAKEEFLKEAISFCKKYGIILAYDAAYSEIYFDEKPVSFLSIDGAKDIGIEFNTLSKTYNMTGWRIGWACGNERLISSLCKIKENIDTGVFEAIQIAGIEALSGPQDCVKELRNIYKKRRDIFAEGIRKLGWDFRLPKGTFYVWVKGEIKDSIKMAKILLEETNIVAIPGVGFGPSGEGYLRFSLTIPEDRIIEGIKRMEEKWGRKK
ncbi:MAG TPA: aminotransferase class I/II-fold pyridoxal phosphate-dependent enzyme [Firmicutes bacterium]|nr:aminotransferase class I/II-fold pyridoxal phosphate-dependent enzyme [Bacillota bacterium]